MEKILIATDFSAAADNAVEYGTDLSKFLNAEILLVNSFKLPLEGYDLKDPLRVMADLQENALEKLQYVKARVISRLGYDPGITCISEPGRALDVIKIAADKNGVDLVVAGLIGEAGPLKRHIIGSTALDLADHLSVPVLIVPEHTNYRKLRRISFAWDRPLNEKPT